MHSAMPNIRCRIVMRWYSLGVGNLTVLECKLVHILPSTFYWMYIPKAHTVGTHFDAYTLVGNFISAPHGGLAGTVVKKFYVRRQQQHPARCWHTLQQQQRHQRQQQQQQDGTEERKKARQAGRQADRRAEKKLLPPERKRGRRNFGVPSTQQVPGIPTSPL